MLWVKLKLTKGKALFMQFSRCLFAAWDTFWCCNDDGSHSVRDQLITLKFFYPLLKSEGIYVIEDLDHYKVSPHLNPDQEANTTVEVLEAIKCGKTINSTYLQKNDFENMIKSIKYINFERGDYNQKGVNISSIAFLSK